jgi:hypothetical protein
MIIHEIQISTSRRQVPQMRTPLPCMLAGEIFPGGLASNRPLAPVDPIGCKKPSQRYLGRGIVDVTAPNPFASKYDPK